MSVRPRPASSHVNSGWGRRPHNNPRAGTKAGAAVFEFCERSVPIAILPCSWHGPVLYLTVPATRARRGPTVVERVPRPMGLCDPIRLARSVDLLTAVPLLAAILLAGGPAAAQTSIRFTLDGRLEGVAATFFLPQDRGYFKAEG